MSAQSHPKVVLDFARGRVRTGRDAEDFTTEGMIATRGGVQPRTARGDVRTSRWQVRRAGTTLHAVWRSARSTFS